MNVSSATFYSQSTLDFIDQVLIVGCFTRDRTSPNAASVTSSLARVCVFRECGGSNLARVCRLFFALPMELCENSILSISFFPISFFFFVRSLPITNCSFCIRSKYRSLLTGLITSICHVLDDTRILRFLPVIVFFEVSEEINKKWSFQNYVFGNCVSLEIELHIYEYSFR